MKLSRKTSFVPAYLSANHCNSNNQRTRLLNADRKYLLFSCVAEGNEDSVSIKNDLPLPLEPLDCQVILRLLTESNPLNGHSQHILETQKFVEDVKRATGRTTDHCLALSCSRTRSLPRILLLFTCR